MLTVLPSFMAVPRQIPWSSFRRDETPTKPLLSIRLLACDSVKLFAPGSGGVSDDALLVAAVDGVGGRGRQQSGLIGPCRDEAAVAGHVRDRCRHQVKLSAHLFVLIAFCLVVRPFYRSRPHLTGRATNQDLGRLFLAIPI